MKKRKIKMIVCALLAVCAAAGITAYAAYNYGTKDDPLITKSYLDEVLTPELMAEFNAQLDAHGSTSEEGTFKVVTLNRGKTIKCQVGCEVMLRIGTAYASGSDSPALVDTTSGTTLENGAALEKNHLYMATIEGNGLTSSADGSKVLVSGEYTVS